MGSSPAKFATQSDDPIWNGLLKEWMGIRKQYWSCPSPRNKMPCYLCKQTVVLCSFKHYCSFPYSLWGSGPAVCRTSFNAFPDLIRPMSPVCWMLLDGIHSSSSYRIIAWGDELCWTSSYLSNLCWLIFSAPDRCFALSALITGVSSNALCFNAFFSLAVSCLLSKVKECNARGKKQSITRYSFTALYK